MKHIGVSAEKFFHLIFLYTITGKSIKRSSKHVQFVINHSPVNDHTKNILEVTALAVKLPCTVCGAMLTPGQQATRHQKRHQPPSVKCPIEGCFRSFYESNTLQFHLETHNVYPETCKCSLCNKKFAFSSVLDRHVARNHNSVKVPCNVTGCLYSTARKEYMAKHYRSHKNISDDIRNHLLEKLRITKGWRA